MKNKEPRPYNLTWIRLFVYLTYYAKVLAIHLDYYTAWMMAHNRIVVDYKEKKEELYK